VTKLPEKPVDEIRGGWRIGCEIRGDEGGEEEVEANDKNTRGTGNDV
jgi:hypothetical protein